ncbi:MAG: sugar phosphate isomerase/epimerase [Cyclobacteriaceae bacterium]|nr:sugar phosphate isomerase/epimerase [Cyclobacteriaceae bacterium]
MAGKKQNSLSRLCLHTITTKPWPLEMAVEKYILSGIRGISVWRNYLHGRDLNESSRILKESGLEVVSLVRGGFFTGASFNTRKKALDDNKAAVDEAAAINAGMLVLVCGATPGQSLEVSRGQIRTALETLVPYAEKNNIRLTIEPLHPMYADSRSAINTLEQANELAEYFNSPWLGIAVDVYHLWWDPHLEEQIHRCAQGNNLYAVHICDWKSPTLDMLNDRELMGKGIIELNRIIGWIEKKGFSGFYEIEIFSDRYWKSDQDDFLKEIIKSYLRYGL